MACIAMACIAMAYVAMACIVMAYCSSPTVPAENYFAKSGCGTLFIYCDFPHQQIARATVLVQDITLTLAPIN